MSGIILTIAIIAAVLLVALWMAASTIIVAAAIRIAGDHGGLQPKGDGRAVPNPPSGARKTSGRI
jgi:hypothetical protein